MHPLHPALAHFPIGALGIGTGLDVTAGLDIHSETLWPISTLLLVIGIATAVLTIAAGIWDFGKLLKTQSTLFDNIVRHAAIMICSWCIYIFAVILRFEDGELGFLTGLPVGLSVAGLATLMIGGWYGGDLVYGHSANVNRGICENIDTP